VGAELLAAVEPGIRHHVWGNHPLPREFTVVLRNEAGAPQAAWGRGLAFLNDLIKSPLFVFVFGASVGTVYPTVKEWLTPADRLSAQHAEENARADAALIAPFIASLDVNKPGQFEAARAALRALERSANAAEAGDKRVMFGAVNEAIEAVAIQLHPPTGRTLSAEDNKQIEVTAAPIKAQPAAGAPILSLLSKDTVVYVQVDRNDVKSEELASRTVAALRAASVLAPSVEKLATSTMPTKTQVRYYFDDDRVKAEQLAALVSQVTGREVLLAKPKLAAKAGTLEVWFGTGD
jgi:hypothetical protein